MLLCKDDLWQVVDTETEPMTTQKNGKERQAKAVLSLLEDDQLIHIRKQLQVCSLVAFICEEIIEHCENCGGLYFFEFVSCSASLLVLLLLIVYFTPLKHQVDLPSILKIDFYITAGVGIVFLIASITFAATKDSNDLATVSVIFGFLATACFIIEVYIMWKNGRCPIKRKTTASTSNGTAEGQPLNNPAAAQATPNPV
uniref:CKLF like MARVEL transmembrane domain containing 6 n=1 Tax=Leptobrachium leishanense TaxID=445787 RepID=A0A8C5QKJ6_9ANUR